MIPLERAYLCPDGHITASAERCECGTTNLVSLQRILDRDGRGWDYPTTGLLASLNQLPTLKILESQQFKRNKQ